MPTPVTRPNSSNLYLHKKVPLRLQELVGKTQVWVSLKTDDPDIAAERCAHANTKLKLEWARQATAAATAGLPKPPRLPAPEPEGSNSYPGIEPPRLLHQDLHALRATAHVRIRDGHIANPPSAGFGTARLLARDLEESMREFLTEQGVDATEADLEAFRPLYAQARRDSVEDLRRAKLDGDYSPNPVLAKLPARTKPDLDFVVAFEQYAEHGGLKGGKFGPSAKRWRPKIKDFCTWLGHRDLARVTSDDGIQWMDHLIEQGFARKSVRDVWLASLKATAGYMIERRKLKANPFAGIRVRGVKESRCDDEKAFTDDQAQTILTATLETPSHLISIEMRAARRWVPWLCAYSGARINEITSLWPENIVRLDGHWSLILRADLTKAATERKVPIHKHVLDQGFLAYVDERRRAGKPLFYDPERSRGGKAANPHWQKVAERLAEWVRESLHIVGPQPNHAWRHRFKSVVRHVGMHAEVANFIVGHGGGSVSERYGSRWIKTAANAIAKYPRYRIAGLKKEPGPHRRRRRTTAQIAADTAAKSAKKAARAKRAA